MLHVKQWVNLRDAWNHKISADTFYTSLETLNQLGAAWKENSGAGVGGGRAQFKGNINKVSTNNINQNATGFSKSFNKDFNIYTVVQIYFWSPSFSIFFLNIDWVIFFDSNGKGGELKKCLIIDNPKFQNMNLL